MDMIDLNSSIQYLKGVGPKRAALFSRLEIKTIVDLLRLYPRTYEDWTSPIPINEYDQHDSFCIKAFALSHPTRHMIRRELTLFKFKMSDSLSRYTFNATIFNNRFAADMIETGEEYLLNGKVTRNGAHYELTVKEIIPASNNERIRPIYPQTEGLSSKIIEKTIASVLSSGEISLEDCLNDDIRSKFNLCHYRYAIENIHFPAGFKALNDARRRLVFEELFTLQIAMHSLRHNAQQTTDVIIKHNYSAEFYSLLPFSPTNAQYRAVNECLNDMGKNISMHRLLQGDVGSGKTAVAAAVCHSIIKNGWQAALMAPTEILAMQHYSSISKLLEPTGIACALLTGSTPLSKRREILSGLENGSIQFIVGTHALISDNVSFKALGLVVTDEQHRFGVAQRAKLANKGCNPHLLVMSATPIPRSLALIIYGDLDISILDEMPAGRQIIETYKIDSQKRERAFNFIKKHLDEGRQAYIVCPLVEQNETGLAAVEQYVQEITNKAFANYRVGLLHGKMKAAQKEAIMKDFYLGELQLLVSTTVIEVGIDVPNAVIMLIENAERFGLSQLHQLRGRVGRGKHQSYCILVSDAKGDDAKRRLNIMCNTNDGFVIADEDLKLRGPGDFFGKRQHGLPELHIADLNADIDILKAAKSAADQLLEADPHLLNPQNQPISAAANRLIQSVGTYGLS